MANWLAMAQAARQVNAAANAVGMSGMVPNPMLAIPGLFGNVGVGVNNPLASTAGNASAGTKTAAANNYLTGSDMGQKLMTQHQHLH
jgi:hypothetical protein